MNVRKISFVLMLIVWIISIHCEEEEHGAGFEILVVDETGNPIEGASVSLYPRRTSFLEEIAKIAVRSTDAHGQVTFSGLSLDQSYYLDVRFEDLTNWVEASLPYELNEKHTILQIPIKENWYSYLSSASGKGWSPRKVAVKSPFGEVTFEYESCIKDDVYVLYKNFDVQWRNGLKCDFEESNISNGTWSWRQDNLRLTYFNHTDSFEITEIGEGYFIGDMTWYDGTELRVYFERSI